MSQLATAFNVETKHQGVYIPSAGLLGTRIVLMREGGLDMRASEKGVPLSITILYGTPHSSRTDITWNIALCVWSVADKILIQAHKFIGLPCTFCRVRVHLEAKSSDIVTCRTEQVYIM